MVEAGRVVRLGVERIVPGGDGIGRVDGRACFVPLSAPGDLLEARVNCEQNSLLYIVRPRRGGICHTKNQSGEPRNCYYRRIDMDTLALTNLDA